jgi:hypothetical protein
MNTLYPDTKIAHSSRPPARPEEQEALGLVIELYAFGLRGLCSAPGGGTRCSLQTKEEPIPNPCIRLRVIPVIRNAQRRHAPTPNRIKDRHWSRYGFDFRAIPSPMPTPRIFPGTCGSSDTSSPKLRMPQRVPRTETEATARTNGPRTLKKKTTLPILHEQNS